MDLTSHNNMKRNEDNEQQKVLSVINSCIASAKESLTLDQLQRDYKQLVGSPIPFKKFQHGTLASFLQSVPQVVKVFNRGGLLYVKAVSSEQTNHIERLIRGQKKSKSKRNFTKPNPIRKPRSTAWVPPSYSQRPHYGAVLKPPLLPTPLFPLQPNNFRQPLLYNQPPKKPQNFCVSGNLYIPRPIINSEKTSSEKLKTTTKLVPLLNKQETKLPANSFKFELERETNRKGIHDVSYNTIRCGKKNSYWISTLTVGEKQFSSYPEEKRIPAEAEEEVSRKALESLKGFLKPSSYPKTTDFELATQRIKQLLSDETDGVWWQHIREEYSKAYHESVDSDWVVRANKKRIKEINFNQPTNGLWILSLKRDTRLRSKTTEASKLASHEQAKSRQPPPLKLPKEKMWSVFVSYFKDCSEVWFRLVGEEYSDAYENLVTDMELHYMEKNNLSPVTSPVIDDYYACSHEDSWFRVRLVTIEGANANVFFIDHGDNETLPASSLFCLEPKFLQLPCQSINSCLAGFECGFSDATLLSSAQTLALGKPLVAKVLSRGETISVVLYDTSTNEDVNINERLIQTLPQAYPEPVFPTEGGVCEVYVCNVTSGGDIYVRIESASYKVLESLLITARKRAAEILGDDNPAIDMGKLYLAKFSPDGEWQRAAPRSSYRDSDGKSQLCRLHSVPSSAGLQWTQKASERLISLFSKRDEPLLLKVIKEGRGDQPTLVELFQRVQPQNLLVSINATLDMDSSLFSNEDKNNNLNCERKKEATLTPSLPLKEEGKKLESSSLVGETLALQKLSPPSLPEVNTYFDVFVTYAASPSHFAVQAWRNTIKLEWLMGEMKSFYSDTSNLKSVGRIHQGGFYALLHTDELWYRVRIDQIGDELVSGVFVDYGDCFCSTTENIQPLWPNFKQFSYQAFKAKMGGILPNNIDWTPEDSCRFRQLVENRAFVSIVTQIIKSDLKEPPTLVLRLVDTKDPAVDKYIDKVLIQEGRARPCSDENKVSLS